MNRMKWVSPVVFLITLGVLCIFAPLSALAFDAAADSVAGVPKPKVEPRADESKTNNMVEPVLLPLYHYKPIYFLAGNPYAKIQISFRTNLVESLPLFFGYTQLAMWDALVNHPAFYDLNYNPDVFYRFVTDRQRSQWLDLGAFEHESNGKGVDGEKSWNRVYVRYHDKTRVGNIMTMEWSLKAWWALNYNVSNQDLQRYRGIYEAEIMLSQIFPSFLDQGDVTLRIYPGGPSTVNPLRGGQELTFRTKVRWSPVLPLVMAQVFHGYGENLMDYKNDRWGIRGGFGF